MAAELKLVSRYRRAPSQADDGYPDELETPTLADVERFILSLDANTIDQVVVEVVMVSGEKADVYIRGGKDAANLIITDPVFQHYLFDPGLPKDQIATVASGGIETECPRNQVVPLATVYVATKVFLEECRLDPAFSWWAEPSVIRRRNEG